MSTSSSAGEALGGEGAGYLPAPEVSHPHIKRGRREPPEVGRRAAHLELPVPRDPDEVETEGRAAAALRVRGPEGGALGRARHRGPKKLAEPRKAPRAPPGRLEPGLPDKGRTEPRHGIPRYPQRRNSPREFTEEPGAVPPAFDALEAPPGAAQPVDGEPDPTEEGVAAGPGDLKPVDVRGSRRNPRNQKVEGRRIEDEHRPDERAHGRGAVRNVRVLVRELADRFRCSRLQSARLPRLPLERGARQGTEGGRQGGDPAALARRAEARRQATARSAPLRLLTSGHQRRIARWANHAQEAALQGTHLRVRAASGGTAAQRSWTLCGEEAHLVKACRHVPVQHRPEVLGEMWGGEVQSTGSRRPTSLRMYDTLSPAIM